MRPSSRLTSHQSKKFTANKKARLYVRVTYVTAIIGIIIFGLAELSYINAMTIKDISVSGTNSSVGFDLTVQALKEMDGSYLGLFSKSNIFLYPHDDIVASVLSSVPQVQSVSIKRNGFLGLNVDVVERKAEAIVCMSLPELSEDGNTIIDDSCLLADKSGLLFDKVGDDVIPLNRYYLPLASSASTTEKEVIGHFATSSEEFTKLQDFYNNARRSGMDPQFLLVKEGGEYELYASNVIIYFNNQRPFEEQLLNLVSFWNHPGYEQYHQGDGADFEYIDVRFGDKIFYRLVQ